jgi:hypothetical protein
MPLKGEKKNEKQNRKKKGKTSRFVFSYATGPPRGRRAVDQFKIAANKGILAVSGIFLIATISK